MPNQKPLLYIIDGFKTINKKLKKNLLPKDVGFNALNLRFDETYGGLAKRKTRSKYNQTTLGTNDFTGIHRYYKNSNASAHLIMGNDTNCQVGYDSVGVFSNIKTGLKTVQMSFQTYKDLEYIVNGSDNNFVFNASEKTTTVEDMGIPSITAPTAVISDTAGNLSGSVTYAVSQQLDGYQEGNASPSSASVDVNGSHGKVTMPTSVNTRCTGRYLYRSRAGGGALYRLATISDNTTTSYDDNIADSSLDTSILYPINYGIPDIYKYITLHKERLFLANTPESKSDIVFSDIRSGSSYPDVFRPNNVLYIAKDDGDEITALKNDQYGQLIVFKKNSVRLINTVSDSPLNWWISDNLSVQGCVSPYTAASTPMGIIYMTRYGENRKRLVLWTGQRVQVIPQLEGLEPILTEILDTDLNTMQGHYHNGYYYMSYRDPKSGVAYQNRVLVINTLDWSWSIDKKNVANFCSWNGGNDEGELYTTTSDGTGFIMREDAKAFDLLVRYKSEVDEGVFSYCSSLGAEATPSIIVNNSAAGQIAERSWASFSTTDDQWSDFTGYWETWWHSGEWYDAIREIGAANLKNIFWGESNGVGGDVMFYVRTGDTTAAVEAAAWNGPYNLSNGADISDVAGGTYIQARGRIMLQDLNNNSETAIIRQGTSDTQFVYRVSANKGTPAESTIEFDWESGSIDLGLMNEVYKRNRKRLRSVRIEYEGSSAEGNFDFEWYMNDSVTRQGYFNTSFTTYSDARTYNFPLNSLCDDFIYRIYSNSDTDLFKIKKVIFTLTVEPYAILRKNL